MRRRRRKLEALHRALEGGGRLAEADRAGGVGHFDPDRLRGIPECARRYLLHAIAPGTALATSVRLAMRGSIRLSPSAAAFSMSAVETLAPPRGYVWEASVRRGPLVLSGFDAFVDGRGEMRWWLAGIVPVVRAEGEALARSALGRMVGEAVFLPSVLLPSEIVRWTDIDDRTAAVRFSAHGEEVELALELDPDGRLVRLSFPRWNADPRNGPLGYQPFVCDNLTGERCFDGYTIPTRYRAGWRLGSENEFPFFFATIEGADYRRSALPRTEPAAGRYSARTATVSTSTVSSSSVCSISGGMSD